MRKLICLTVVGVFLLASMVYGAVNFTDVKESDWYYKSLNIMVDEDIISGYPDGTFKPSNNLKFEEFVKMVTVAVSDEDIKVSDGLVWYENYINTALENDYITEPMLLNLGKNIDRKTMADILYRVIDKVEGTEDYSDDECSYLVSKLTDLSANDTKTLTIAGMGIICGYPDGTFKPNNNLTRSETVAVISRLINEAERLPVDFNAQPGNVDTRTLDELPPVDLSHLYDYPTLSGRTVEEENKSNRKMVDVSRFAKDAIMYINLMHNRDYENFERRSFEKDIVPYLNAYKEYKGVMYDEGLKSYHLEFFKDDKAVIDYINTLHTWIEDFFSVWAKETISNGVKVQSSFYTDDDLVITTDACFTVRGIWRIKYDSHLNPDNIKYELDLVDSNTMREGKEFLNLGEKSYNIYLNFDRIPELEVGKWYEIEMDIVMRSGAPAKGLEYTDVYSYKYIYPISIREID